MPPDATNEWHPWTPEQLSTLTRRELLIRLARTEDATRTLTSTTITKTPVNQLLAYQHAILAELRRRSSST